MGSHGFTFLFLGQLGSKITEDPLGHVGMLCIAPCCVCLLPGWASKCMMNDDLVCRTIALQIVRHTILSLSLSLSLSFLSS